MTLNKAAANSMKYKCDESWYFQYDSEAKPQSAEWNSQNSPQAKKPQGKFHSKPKQCSLTLFDTAHLAGASVNETSTYLGVSKHTVSKVMTNIVERQARQSKIGDQKKSPMKDIDGH
ncbi:hypothetical protein TNCV_1917441 [Trichonephila clavipes]|uniref:Uncharacterized protein n=1 Tax=Trichonephila clavipes TaxID=2585209 RepID=A0A8X6W0W6_TRICX|nr:hypothetical protein TNCV_1917441 [Trichonephila clavipes]